LIDTNGDETWDYTFNPTEGLAALQIVEKKGTPGFRTTHNFMCYRIDFIMEAEKQI